MYLSMFLIAAFFVFAVMSLSRRLVRYLEHRLDEDLEREKRKYNSLSKEKEELLEKQAVLESEASKIFTLYSMTREITRKMQEQEAFAVFKDHLKQNVRFKECRLVHPNSPEIKDLKKSGGHFLFTLKGEKDKLGYLVFQGVEEEDKDKALILAHQFTLVLKRVKLQQEIERLSITDSLTGVHTRRYFMERFEEELKRSKLKGLSLSLMMVDVYYFKKLNDRYGHLTGDQVLKEVGEVVHENLREIDIAGRYGGEEFCVVLPDTDSDGGQFAAERIRRAVEQAEMKVYDAKVRITASFGVATFPKDGQTAQELMDKADWALYRAKKGGRNRVNAFGVYSSDTS